MARSKTIKKPVLDDRNAFQGASGKEYLIEPPEDLGIDRKRAFDGALTKCAFGQDTKSLIRNMVAIKNAFNKQEMAEVGHLIHTQLSVASAIHERRDAVLEICALFMNTKDEDRNKPPTDAQIAEKIQDWNDAGIPFSFFVNSAGTFSDTLRAVLEGSTPSSPGRAKEPTSPEV
jgi:hypothetical protein